MHNVLNLPAPSDMLLPGEVAMSLARPVTLANGLPWLPQHYRRFRHQLGSVRALLADIAFDGNTLLFAGQDQQGVYLQVGLFGRENYAPPAQARPEKLVYGRKWRIDADTPSSEIIQTAYLAIVKAWEHEVREWLTVLEPRSGARSAPFSTHQDLPLIARHPDLLEPASGEADDSLEPLLASLEFGQRPLRLLQCEQRSNGQFLLDLQLGRAPAARQAEGECAEYDDLCLSLLLEQLDGATVLHALMDAVLAHQARLCAEQFTYKGMARFSRRLDPRRIAALSIATRPYRRDARAPLFGAQFQASNYDVDAGRAPSLGTGKLAAMARAAIDSRPQLLGHLPKGYKRLARQA